MIIAIDGPAASGKGTIARRLALHFGLPHLDTGLLYRAVGRAVVEAGFDPRDAEAAARIARELPISALEVPSLRDDATAELASIVGTHPPVREALMEFQRRFAGSPGGAVLDGRDIGTVVCPEADVKIFVTANTEIRAERRVKELRSRGLPAIYAAVLQDLKMRDDRDSRRAVAPLKPAEDAFLLDTSEMSIEAAVAAAIDFTVRRTAGRG